MGDEYLFNDVLFHSCSLKLFPDLAVVRYQT